MQKIIIIIINEILFKKFSEIVTCEMAISSINLLFKNKNVINAEKETKDNQDL